MFASSKATCRARMESSVSISFSASVSTSSDTDDAVYLAVGGSFSLPFCEAIITLVWGVFCNLLDPG